MKITINVENFKNFMAMAYEAGIVDGIKLSTDDTYLSEGVNHIENCKERFIKGFTDSIELCQQINSSVQ